MGLKTRIPDLDFLKMSIENVNRVIHISARKCFDKDVTLVIAR